MLQEKDNPGIVPPEQLNLPKKADMQPYHEYAFKITFTKRQGLSESDSKHLGSVLRGMA